jgi:glycosyltransferase involved in cell wall biosynthesis
MNNLKNKNVLFLVHSYRSFQKDQIEAVAKYFNKVYVLVRYKPIAELFRFLPLNPFSTHTKNYAIDLKDKPDNVFVYEVPLWYLPTDKAYKSLGDLHYKGVEKVIRSKNIEFDLIHCHFTWSAGYVGMRLKTKYGKPLVITGHGYDVYDLPFRDSVWKCKIAQVLNAADNVITVSNRNALRLKDLEVRTNISVITNGYDGKVFHPLDKPACKIRLGLPTDQKIILSVGNLEKIKGHEYLIKAIKLLVNRNPKIKCFIVGDGSLRNGLQKKIKNYSLENHIVLVGKKPHGDIPLWMNAADLFVLPSVNEGSPTVMFEGLACGTPFIGTNVGGIPEIITDTSVGEFVEPKNAEALSNAIEKLLAKRWDAQTISSSVKQYTWGNIGLNISNVYNQLFIPIE